MKSPIPILRAFSRRPPIRFVPLRAVSSARRRSFSPDLRSFIADGCEVSPGLLRCRARAASASARAFLLVGAILVRSRTMPRLAPAPCLMAKSPGRARFTAKTRPLPRWRVQVAPRTNGPIKPARASVAYPPASAALPSAMARALIRPAYSLSMTCRATKKPGVCIWIAVGRSFRCCVGRLRWSRA